MSIYNETENQIRESISSVLFQDFVSFELIIVLDKPDRTDVRAIIDEYKDSRIRFYTNEKNIGLAMSMNRAASLARTNIFIRMDADDIAYRERFQKEYNALISNDVDFVFSRYSYIDNESNELSQDLMPYYSSDELKKKPSIIPSIIHHPTVLFTRSIFEKVGGYRNFPCSQDLDLWLRMQECGCRFMMISDVLLKYRISSNSVSSKRWFQQQITCDYIQKLAIERKRKGYDTFSVENYNIYLCKMGFGNAEKELNLRNGYKLLNEAKKQNKNGNELYSIILKFISIVSTPILRKRAIRQIKQKLYE